MSTTAAQEAWQQTRLDKQDRINNAVREYRRHNSQFPVEDFYQFTSARDTSPDQLEDVVNTIWQQYQSRTSTKILTERILPLADRIRGIAAGMAAISSVNDTAAVCCGVFLLVVECGCFVGRSIEMIADQLDTLTGLLPELTDDIELYKRHPAGLEGYLRDLLGHYLEFFVIMLDWMKNPPIVNLLKSPFSGTLAKALKTSKQEIQTTVSKYKAAIYRIRKHQENAVFQKSFSSSTSLTLKPGVKDLCHLPRLRNLDFCGRTTELDALHGFLLSDSKDSGPSRVTSCAITGMGGVGKSDIALEFCFKHLGDYNAVLWVTADEDISLKRTFSEIAVQLGIVEGGPLLTNEQVHKGVQVVRDWLRTTDWSWLLVFDNMVSYEEIKPYWPLTSSMSNKRCSILVTTQMALCKVDTWATSTLPIDRLPPDAGQEVLLKYIRLDNLPEDHPDRQVAKEISKRHGGLPLLLEITAGTIDTNHQSLSQWLSDRQDSLLNLDQEYMPDKASWTYVRAPTAVFDPALKRLSKSAQSLLYLMAFLSPSNISEEILLADEELDDFPFLHARAKASYRKTLGELRQAKFISDANEDGKGSKRYMMHPTLQQLVLDIFGRQEDRRQPGFNSVIQFLRRFYPRPNKLKRPDPETSKNALVILPHIMNVKRVFKLSRERPFEGTMAFAELLVEVGGMDLYDQGYISETLSILDDAEEILNQLGTPQDVLYRGHILTVRGMCGDIMGITRRRDTHEWRDRGQQAREAWFRKLPPGEQQDKDAQVLVYNAYMDIACSLQHENKFDEVEKIASKCLVQYRKWGPESSKGEAYEYAKYYNHMAYVYLFRGLYDEAADYAEKGHRFMHQAQVGTQVGLLFHFDWASILYQTRSVDEAIEQHDLVLSQRVHLCGSNNVRTLESHLTLGVIHCREGRFKSALPHLDRAIYANLGMESFLWPRENVVRARYYRARARLGLDPHNVQALEEKRQAVDEARHLAREGDSTSIELSLSDEELVDFILAWELRLVTPRESRTGLLHTKLPLYQMAASRSWESTVFVLVLTIGALLAYLALS